MSKNIIFFLFFIFLYLGCMSGTSNWLITSPDKIHQMSVFLQDGRLYYDVILKTASGKVRVVEKSPLGIQRDDQSFVEPLVFMGKTGPDVIEEKYSLSHGKKTECAASSFQTTLLFANQAGTRFEFIVRAFNDGIAFRYRFPDEDSTLYTITGEETGFKIPAGAVGFMQPHDNPSMWTPAYETFYQKDIPVGTASSIEAGWSFPVLFELENSCWVLMTEALMDGGYCGTRLEQQVNDNIYKIRFPDKGEGESVGKVEPTFTLPWATPWRVVLFGESPASIVESTAITDLNPDCALEDVSWIKPGRVSWSWWSEQDSPKNFKRLKDFIDLAADMGWEYSLIDANWDEMGESKLRQLADYGKQKNVGILLWYNSGGAHNIVTEKPRDRMHERGIRRREFKYLQKLGISGVKVDFFQSDKQDRIQQYIDILRDAADYHLLVNFHGCTLPRGWSRTYPNLMSMEAVRGAECYIFDGSYPETAPWYNTILPFTRNVVGPMDYTPVTFSNNRYPHLTSSAHELALSVVFQSGWLHMADRVEAYQALPEEPKQFLKDVPVVWNETRFIDGYPGKFVVIARRFSSIWYIAGINGEMAEKELELNLSLLGNAEFSGVYITDGQEKNSFISQKIVVLPGENKTVKIKPLGGFVIRLTKS
ncbi:glycoside hydrolase family 97 protein [candidate division KSB1 bacterium]|nr:glycoside hydrolase family 97 protein [candidate division KSB1 bacterium]